MQAHAHACSTCASTCSLRPPSEACSDNIFPPPSHRNHLSEHVSPALFSKLLQHRSGCAHDHLASQLLADVVHRLLGGEARLLTAHLQNLTVPVKCDEKRQRVRCEQARMCRWERTVPVGREVGADKEGCMKPSTTQRRCPDMHAIVQLNPSRHYKQHHCPMPQKVPPSIYHPSMHSLVKGQHNGRRLQVGVALPPELRHQHILHLHGPRMVHGASVSNAGCSLHSPSQSKGGT